jgi:hypothetical protein
MVKMGFFAHFSRKKSTQLPVRQEEMRNLVLNLLGEPNEIAKFAARPTEEG